MSAARALARAEALGVRLHLGPDGQVKMRGAAPPPPDVLADLHRWREDVAHLLALRAATAGPTPPPVPDAPTPPLPQPDAWLAGVAGSIGSALSDSAIRIADTDGGLTLVRADGRHLAVAPHIIAELAAAELLPDLPDAVEASVEDDPVERAERAAIASEPRLPPLGTPARARLDDAQTEMVRGLLEAARVRPPCFEGEASRPPPQGAYCSCCGGRAWWCPCTPKTDGTTPSGHWRCTTCRPAPNLSETEIVRIET